MRFLHRNPPEMGVIVKSELELLLEGMRLAGNAIQTLQRDGFSVERKANNDLLTEADLAANNILRDHLAKHFPDAGWLSEESVDDVARLNCKRVFVVDPIDGTIEFAKGIPEYAISVALVEGGQPVLASVYNPATNELFYAEKGKGAWLNGKRIYCSDKSSESLIMLASRSEDNRGEWDEFKQDHVVKIVGSIAYKLALVASGIADVTFSLKPKNEWDIAAGVLMVQEAGGVVATKHGEPIVFNQLKTLVDSVVASSAVATPSVRLLVQQPEPQLLARGAFTF